MGSSQSSRKLTVANDSEDVSVIRISDAVAKRLAEGVAQEQSKSAPAPAVPVKNPIHQEQLDPHYTNFTISALEMQQQKERELSEQDSYWQKRLLNLEKTHKKINRAIEEEYKKALTIFDDSKVIKVQDSVKPCNENKQKVLKCYQDNPKETLRCAELVQQFSNCVDQRRAQLMKCN